MILDFHQKKRRSQIRSKSGDPNIPTSRFDTLSRTPNLKTGISDAGGISAIWVLQPWLCGNAFRVAWIGRSFFSDGSSVRGFLSLIIFFERKFHAITCLGGHKYRDLLNEFFEGGCMKVTPHFLLGNIFISRSWIQSTF